MVEVAGDRWQVAGGRWQVAGGRWQVAGREDHLAEVQVSLDKQRVECEGALCVCRRLTPLLLPLVCGGPLK